VVREAAAGQRRVALHRGQVAHAIRGQARQPSIGGHGHALGGSLTDTMDLADQAMRSQNAAMDKLSQQSATNVNSQARLEAVEAEIKDLKAKADAALEREKAARDEAAAKKAQVDQLIADTTRLDAELQAAKPGIQSQMAAVTASQNSVANEIVERDRRLREAWEAEQRRQAEAAAAAARAQGQAVQPYAPVTGSPSAFGLRHPFDGNIPITSGFGWRTTPPGTIDFYGTGGYMHTGIDFGAACGTPVYAAAAGEIFSSGWNSADGGGWRVGSRRTRAYSTASRPVRASPTIWRSSAFASIAAIPWRTSS